MLLVERNSPLRIGIHICMHGPATMLPEHYAVVSCRAAARVVSHLRHADGCNAARRGCMTLALSSAQICTSSVQQCHYCGRTSRRPEEAPRRAGSHATDGELLRVLGVDVGMRQSMQLYQTIAPAQSSIHASFAGFQRKGMGWVRVSLCFQQRGGRIHQATSLLKFPEAGIDEVYDRVVAMPPYVLAIPSVRWSCSTLCHANGRLA